jgi:hypothetical protein
MNLADYRQSIINNFRKGNEEMRKFVKESNSTEKFWHKKNKHSHYKKLFKSCDKHLPEDIKKNEFVVELKKLLRRFIKTSEKSIESRNRKHERKQALTRSEIENFISEYAEEFNEYNEYFECLKSIIFPQ